MNTQTKKVGLMTREKIISEIKERAQEAQACYFISFNKLPAYPFNVLRNDLAASNTKVFITKNSLFLKALSEIGWEDFDNLLEAETALVLVYDEDVVKPAKTLVDFSKEFESLKLKGGVIKDKKVGAKELIALAKLPSREVLLGTALSAISSPLTGFLSALNQIICKFVWVVEEIKKVKETK
tara:strand:+ start:1339 stop:1884 length:546 start_codon:yes stop_codon:yes gene_type:complete